MKLGLPRTKYLILVVAFVLLALSATNADAWCRDEPDIYCWSACSWLWQWCEGYTFNAACFIHWGPGVCSTGPPPVCCGDNPGF